MKLWFGFCLYICTKFDGRQTPTLTIKTDLYYMDAKFSPRVREIMFRSHEEAVKLGNSYIGLEHLFLGIIDGKDNGVTDILDELKLDIEA